MELARERNMSQAELQGGEGRSLNFLNPGRTLPPRWVRSTAAPGTENSHQVGGVFLASPQGTSCLGLHLSLLRVRELLIQHAEQGEHGQIEAPSPSPCTSSQQYTMDAAPSVLSARCGEVILLAVARP